MSIKNSVLNALEQNRGAFFSGEELSKNLGVSRTAVWKAIKALREEGYRIEAVTNKGYFIPADNWSITEESFRASLPAKYRSNPLHIYETIDSTNLKAKELAAQGAPDGTIVLSRQQTLGRGRLGRKFFSPREGIYVSMLIKPEFDLSHSVLVTAAAAVAVVDAIKNVCGIDAKIKWVNDIYIGEKKVCGILTEGISDFETGQIQSLIIGTGVNTTIADFPPELLDIVGAVEGDYSKSALAAEIAAHTLEYMENINNRAFMDTYRRQSMVIGKNVTVYKTIYPADPDAREKGMAARVLDIDDDGGLMVLYSNGTQETITAGEVSIRL